MKLMRNTILTLAASTLLLAACDGQQNAYNARQGGVMGGGSLTKSDVGTGLGAIGGAVIGSSFGKGNGRVVGGVIGGLLGAGIGNSVGASLDRSDMTYYEQTSQRALENGRPGQSLPWKNAETGNSGVIIPKNYYKNASGDYCREFQNKITVGGKTESGYGTACRQPDGSWQIVSD